MSTLHAIFAVVAGLAIVLLAAAVVFEIDLRHGGALNGAAWLVAAFLGGALVLQALAGVDLDGLTVGLACAFALLGWRYRALLQAEARKPRLRAEAAG